MVAVSQCMSVPKTAATMREMQKEMYKAGLIEEVMEEGIADAMGDDEVRGAWCMSGETCGIIMWIAASAASAARLWRPGRRRVPR